MSTHAEDVHILHKDTEGIRVPLCQVGNRTWFAKDVHPVFAAKATENREYVSCLLCKLTDTYDGDTG